MRHFGKTIRGLESMRKRETKERRHKREDVKELASHLRACIDNLEKIYVGRENPSKEVYQEAALFLDKWERGES